MRFSTAKRLQIGRPLARALAALPISLAPARPSFIIGCARSGTSILKRVLGRHKGIDAYPGEANDLWHPVSYPWIGCDHAKPPLWRDPRAFTELSLSEWPDGHGERIRREFGIHQRLRGKNAFLNKSAMIAFMLPVVSELFPEARFIHIVRDGRAVALSYAHKEFGKMQANEELYRACGVWCTFDELLEQMSRLWVAHIDEIDGVAERESWKEKGFYFECRYEDFCERPRELMAEIVGFMGFPNPRVSLEDEVRSMNHKFRQELSPEAIRSITAIMAETLTRKGYELHEEERSRPVLSSHGEEADSRGR